LIADIPGTLGTPTGLPNFDDVVGTLGLMLSTEDLTPPTSKKRIKKLDVKGGNEGAFRVAIELAFQN